MVDNEETLLDKSDLVFIDPVGTGYSTAIDPYTNRSFWGVDSDAKVIRDFITSYNNLNNRQASPKYLYGESYGGIRTPIVADLLLAAGTSSFEPDASGKPAIVLSGFVLNTPLVDYTSNCGMPGSKAYCAGYFPSYAMVADYFGLPQTPTARGQTTQEAYLENTRQFVTQQYLTTLTSNPTTGTDFWGTSPWTTFAATQAGTTFLTALRARTGIATSIWKADPNLKPDKFRANLLSGFKIGRFDARMRLPRSSVYDPDEYIDDAFNNGFKELSSDFLNYNNPSSSHNSVDTDNNVIGNWNWNHRGRSAVYSTTSLPDLESALTYNPSLKLLILHGYEDVATPGYQTELDLKSVNRTDRIPVKWFEGGHMTYNDEASRRPMKDVLDEYYDNPRYSLPPASALN
jgi:carboxypeptidase C (cathepsin A)